jgi:hypothetical protein
VPAVRSSLQCQQLPTTAPHRVSSAQSSANEVLNGPSVETTPIHLSVSNKYQPILTKFRICSLYQSTALTGTAWTRSISSTRKESRAWKKWVRALHPSPTHTHTPCHLTALCTTTLFLMESSAVTTPGVPTSLGAAHLSERGLQFAKPSKPSRRTAAQAGRPAPAAH